jgi:choline dehydrogenase-like flavoprotein
MAKAMRQDIMSIATELKLEGQTPPSEEISVFGKNIHECGTARMGDNPKTSVVDRNCKVHHVPNLFVSDGAVFPTQSAYEPTLTIMAIAARAGEHIAESLRRGEL